MKEPKDFNEAVKRIKEQQEAPVLNDSQVSLLQSGYVNSMDEVVAVLEQAEREPANGINRYHRRDTNIKP